MFVLSNGVITLPSPRPVDHELNLSDRQLAVFARCVELCSDWKSLDWIQPRWDTEPQWDPTPVRNETKNISFDDARAMLIEACRCGFYGMLDVLMCVLAPDDCLLTADQMEALRGLPAEQFLLRRSCSLVLGWDPAMGDNCHLWLEILRSMDELDANWVSEIERQAPHLSSEVLFRAAQRTQPRVPAALRLYQTCPYPRLNTLVVSTLAFSELVLDDDLNKLKWALDNTLPTADQALTAMRWCDDHAPWIDTIDSHMTLRMGRDWFADAKALPPDATVFTSLLVQGQMKALKRLRKMFPQVKLVLPPVYRLKARRLGSMLPEVIRAALECKAQVFMLGLLADVRANCNVQQVKDLVSEQTWRDSVALAMSSLEFILECSF